MSTHEPDVAILATVDPPVAFTLLGLVCAFLCLVFAAEKQLSAAVLCLGAAGLIDFFDGWVARKWYPDGVRTPMSSRLDAIVDVCSFGMAPAALAYAYGLKGPFYVALLALYLIANALRLGYFLSRPPTMRDGVRYYIGLPVTYAALVLPWAFLGTLAWGPALMRPVLAGVYALLAAAMVSGIQVRKPAGAWYGIYTAIGLLPLFVFAWSALHGR